MYTSNPNLNKMLEWSLILAKADIQDIQLHATYEMELWYIGWRIRHTMDSKPIFDEPCLNSLIELETKCPHAYTLHTKSLISKCANFCRWYRDRGWKRCNYGYTEELETLRFSYQKTLENFNQRIESIQTQCNLWTSTIERMRPSFSQQLWHQLCGNLVHLENRLKFAKELLQQIESLRNQVGDVKSTIDRLCSIDPMTVRRECGVSTQPLLLLLPTEIVRLVDLYYFSELSIDDLHEILKARAS